MTDKAPASPLDRLINEKIAAEILGISADTLRRLNRRGEGPKRRQISPRRVGYKVSEVEAYRDGKLRSRCTPKHQAARESHSRRRRERRQVRLPPSRKSQ